MAGMRKEYDPNKAGRRKRRPIIYIICEGKETEIKYFKHFRSRNCLVDIVPISSKHKAAEHLVKHAKGLLSQSDYFPKDGDQLWCVFDCDDNKNSELKNAADYAEKHGYKIAYSNPCFEYWYLLHFVKQNSYLNGAEEVLHQLQSKGRLEKYEKNLDVFADLLPHQSEAMQRARERLDSLYKDNVVILSRDSNPVTTVCELVEYNLSGFAQLDLSQNGFQKLQHVKEKWTKYFVNAEEMSLIQELRADKRFAQFSEYGIINVGITTGNNGYFSITEETSEQYQLSEVTLPLIGRSSHAHGIYFTAQDWEKNKIAGKRARLISFPEIPYDEYPAKHKEYISLGEANGEHEGYKCSIRERWYIVPSVWVPDAFFLRRNNFYPKFVLNKCDAVSTDTMHRMKFNDGVDPENVLLAYYNSISFAFTEICGRSYGGGVLEILPGEMGNILLPKVERIDPALRDKLLAHIDAIVRNDEDIELALDVVDKELLVDTLGIDPEICRKCRAIWKKMQTRRLGRG